MPLGLVCVALIFPALLLEQLSMLKFTSTLALCNLACAAPVACGREIVLATVYIRSVESILYVQSVYHTFGPRGKIADKFGRPETCSVLCCGHTLRTLNCSDPHLPCSLRTQKGAFDPF